MKEPEAIRPDGYENGVGYAIFVQCEEQEHYRCDEAIVFMSRLMSVCTCKCHYDPNWLNN